MGYPLRIVRDGSFHHVMNRGVDRQPVFFSDADRVEFGRLLGEMYERFDIETLAYCLMGNHYHLVVRCPTGQLSNAMQHLGSTFVRHVNEGVGRDGPLFRSRFRSIEIDSDRYLLRAVRYVHRNPLVLPGVDRPDEYRWSSHRTYLGHRRRPVFLDSAILLARFGHDRARFDRFVAGPHFPASARLDLADLRHVIELAVMTIGGDEKTSAASLRRSVSLLLLEHLPVDWRHSWIDELGISNSDALRQALARARRRVDDLPVIARMLEFVVAEVSVIRPAA